MAFDGPNCFSEQKYDVSKKIEHGLKVMRHGSLHPDISAVDPETYVHRFSELCCRIFHS
jgi:hypothetical protein